LNTPVNLNGAAHVHWNKYWFSEQDCS